MSFWDKTKAAAQSAGSATKKAAQKTKLRADIALLKNKVKSAKEKMGVTIYSAMEANDNNGAWNIFQETQRVVHDFEAQIHAKEQQIATLGGKGDAHDHEDEDYTHPPTTEDYAQPPAEYSEQDYAEENQYPQ